MRSLCAPALAAVAIFCAAAASAEESQIERGKYLVTIASCNDCHTPGYFLGKPEFSRTLAGSEVGFTIPGLGAIVGRNLTPDKETGLGNWTDDQIISAITAGIRPDGRRLPPVKNAVPGPFGPKEVPTTLVFTIVPGEVSAKLTAPQ